MRPAPVVGGRRVVWHDAVRRGEHAAARRGHAAQFANRPGRVVAVLEDLVAEDDVEARVLGGNRLDRAAQLGAGILHGIDADVRRGVRGEERLVRLLAAADVEHAVRAQLVVAAASLAREPTNERTANGVCRHGVRRVEPRVRHRRHLQPSRRRLPPDRASGSSPPAAGCPARCRARPTRPQGSGGRRARRAPPRPPTALTHGARFARPSARPAATDREQERKPDDAGVGEHLDVEVLHAPLAPA